MAALQQNVHMPCFMFYFPTNPFITLSTNVCQKTTSQMRTLKIQWHTWIKAGCLGCQVSATVENIRENLKTGLCQNESICYLCSMRSLISFPCTSTTSAQNYFQQMHRCTWRMVTITKQQSPVWHYICLYTITTFCLLGWHLSVTVL